MMRRRLRNDDDGGEDEDLPDSAKGRRINKKENDLKISEMDEWMDSDEDMSDSEGGEEKKNSDDDGEKKKNKKKGTLV